MNRSPIRPAQAPLATLLLLLTAPFALAQPTPAPDDPPFRGPEIHDGAWKVEHAWADPAPSDGPVGSAGSYAYHYREWALARADRYVEERVALDCADLSITLLCEYAAEMKLPVTWRVYYPAEHRFVVVNASDRQFDSSESFLRWSRHYLGAMNLADNTDAITYDEWAGGDMVLMDWNQSPEAPNFEGRTVWHVLIGRPDEVIYYGNISGGQPLPVTRVTGGSRMEMVRTHPDRHGLSPRRYRLFRDAEWAPRAEQAVVARASRLNLRSGPGTEHARVLLAERGQSFPVVARDGLWVQVQLPDGQRAWAHGFYLRIETLPLDPEPEGNGLAGSLTSAQ